MITRAECIDILSSHASELRSRFDLIANHRHIRPFFKKQIEQDGIDIYTATDGR